MSQVPNRSGLNQISLIWIIILLIVIVGGGVLFLSKILSPKVDPSEASAVLFLTEVPQEPSTSPTDLPIPTQTNSPIAVPSFTATSIVTYTPTQERSRRTPLMVSTVPTTLPTPRRTPLSPFNRTDYGLGLMSQGDYALAISQFTTAINLDHQYIDAYYHRGTAYFMFEDYLSAKLDYETVLVLDPDYFESYRGLGDVYYKLKQFDFALDNYEIYLELAGDSAGQAVIDRVAELRGS